MNRPSSYEREHVLAKIQAEALEATTLEDVGGRVFPLLERVFDTSASLFYRFDDEGRSLPLAGTLREAFRVYEAKYAETDPIQGVLRRVNPWILDGARCPEWQEFRALPVYQQFSADLGIDQMLHIRLVDADHFGAGMAGMVFARTRRQAEFNRADTLAMTSLLPVLEVTMRRATRAERERREHAKLRAILKSVEVLLDEKEHPQIALDARGHVVWASPRAERWMNLGRGGRSAVPDALANGARRVIAAAEAGKMTHLKVEVAVPRRGAFPGMAELRLARTASGEPLVIAELRGSSSSPPIVEARARFRLTDAEAEVLELLATGLQDREIARRRFVSVATVRTHLNRILAKLGVRSRVEAVLLAHGISPRHHPDESERATAAREADEAMDDSE